MGENGLALKDQVLELLKSSGGGVGLRQIQRSLSNASALQLRDQLTQLKREGLVFERRLLWHLTREAKTGGSVAEPAAPSRRRFARPRRSKIEIPQSSRWAEFRRLCLYYAECVRLGDRAKVSAYVENENTDYLRMPGPVDWQSLSEGNRLALTIPEDWGPFIRRIKRKNRQPRLFLGAPVDLWIGTSREGETYKVISPVFVQQIEAMVEDDMLHLHPVGSTEINHEWLERRFKKRDDQQTFSELCGFDVLESDDDEQEAGKLPTMQEAATSFYRCYKDWWQEFANLKQLDASPTFDEASKSGVYNRAVLMSQPKLKYSAKLYQELLWLAGNVEDEDLDRTALTHLFPHTRPTRNRQQTASVPQPDEDLPPAITDVGEYEALNQEQRQACRLAMEKPVVIVTGPPGTGKSRVVAQTMANLALRRQPVLFASRNHQALEAVIPRLNELVEPEMLAIRLATPFGDGSAESLTQTVVNVLSSPTAAGVTDRFQDSIHELSKVLDTRKRFDTQRQRVFDLYEEVDRAQIRYEEVLADLPDHDAPVICSCIDLPGVQHVAEMRAALEEMHVKPDRWLRKLFWRIKRRFAGRGVKQKALALDARFCEAFSSEPIGDGEVSDAGYVESVIRTLERWMKAAEANEANKILQRTRRELEHLPDLDKCHQQHINQGDRVIDATCRSLHLLSQSYGATLHPEDRQRFAEIRGELKSMGENSDRQSQKLLRALYASFTSLLNEVPLWATTNLRVGQTVPRVAGAFDLLIIDEASQCDIASVIPLLYRARRAMVVGDPMQLQHVSKTKAATNRRLRRTYDLTDTKFGRFDYPVNSFYDCASTDAGVLHNIQLQEHHRCHHLIAEFCNKTFYRGTLRILTDPDRLHSPIADGKAETGFRWTDLPGDAEGQSGGGSISKGQIAAVVGELDRLSRHGFSGTVGVVTPFTAQANRIRDKVHQELGSRIPERWRFHVSTADGFQGDERDVILFSIPCGSSMPRGSKWFLGNEKNRFNVAVSRARALLHVFADSEWCRTCGIPHIQALHSAWDSQVPQTQQDSIPRHLIGPKWEPAVAAGMSDAGIPFHQQYPACGRYLDFAVFAGSTKLDIEVDGEAFHKNWDGSRKIDDLYRDLTLVANGWRVMRFWVYELREDMQGCIKRIQDAYEEGLRLDKEAITTGSDHDC